MATVRRALALGCLVLALGGCGKLQNWGGPASPLVTFNVTFEGDLAPLRPPHITEERSLKVALVWGAQWLTEPFCILPPESPEAAAVIADGCRDTFGFVPARVDATAPLTQGQPATLPLFQLPTAEVMVGDVTARVAQGSLVVFDDRDGSGTLELSRPHRAPLSGNEPDRFIKETPDSFDIIYGASFVSMTAADQRVIYREGGFNLNGAFYPRAGCAPPLKAFSVAGAGGFSASAALAATLAGTLPQEDPATCTDALPAETTVSIAARAPAELAEVGCDERIVNGSPRYREPPEEQPDLTGRTVACAHLPSFDTGGGLGGEGDVGDAGNANETSDAGTGDAGSGAAGASSLIQLVVSGRPGDRCRGLTHYVLRGCRESVTCVLPDWDYTSSSAISWWPCPR